MSDLCRKSDRARVQFDGQEPLAKKLPMSDAISSEDKDCSDKTLDAVAGKCDELGDDRKSDTVRRGSREKAKRIEGVSASDQFSRKKRSADGGSSDESSGQPPVTFVESDHEDGNGKSDKTINLASDENFEDNTKSRHRKKNRVISEHNLDPGVYNQQQLRNGKTLIKDQQLSFRVSSCASGAESNNYLLAENRADISDSIPLEKRVLTYQDAPSYLKFNPYITDGYRSMLTPRQCISSLFWWTNETLNIWSHLLGWALFLCLSVHDAVRFFSLPTTHPWDRAIMAVLLISFQACMLLSALYHVFCCCSERYYRRWLTADLFGVSLSLLAVYISGIYYAFSCVPFWLSFYLITVGAIFLSAVVLQILPVVHKSGSTTAKAFHGRLIVFGGWAAYGIVPTVHWALLHGGMESPVVALLLPRIFMMYGITAVAFFFYVLRLPEKLYPGLVNFVGSSHQLWHILIVVAFYHWHNTGLLFLQFRSTNSCEAEYEFLFPSIQEDEVILR